MLSAAAASAMATIARLFDAVSLAALAGAAAALVLALDEGADGAGARLSTGAGKSGSAPLPGAATWVQPTWEPSA